jgi:hypothetical protein
MFGLILAAVYVVWKIMTSDIEPLYVFENTLGFLWCWHMTFLVIKGVIWLIVPLVGALFGVAGNRDEKFAGIAAVVLSPLLLFIMAISSVLFIGGVYSLDSGIQDGQIINQSRVVVGSILYFLGTMFQMKVKLNSKNND